MHKPKPNEYKTPDDYYEAMRKYLIETKIEQEASANNGGKTDYYQLGSSPFPINDADDFAEWRRMNFFQGNILKVAWTFNTGRHKGTDYERDLNKIIHYANRELKRLKRENKK